MCPSWLGSRSELCEPLIGRCVATEADEGAVGAYWYYRTSNQTMTEMGRSTLGRLVSSFG